jgi:adenylate cyclase
VIMSRRLAAILAADVVGYSRLMGADEERTHGALARGIELKPDVDSLAVISKNVVQEIRQGSLLERA